jgi:hypothetical protein
MIAKLFELRDERTCIPVLAIRFEREDIMGDHEAEAERYLYRRVGWQQGDVLVLRATGELPPNSPWWQQATAAVRRAILEEHPAGAVIDMRFIRGEVQEPCVSERHE